MDSAKHSYKTSPAAGGNVDLLPRAAAVLSGLFRRNRTGTKKKESTAATERRQTGEHGLSSHWEGERGFSGAKISRSRFSKSAPPECRYKRGISSPLGVLKSRFSSRASVDRRAAPRQESIELTPIEVKPGKKAQHCETVPPHLPSRGKWLFWPLRSSEHQTKELEEDAETSSSTGASESLERAPERQKVEGAAKGHHVDSRARSLRQPETEEPQYVACEEPQETLKEESNRKCSGCRRAAAAGRLRSGPERPCQEKRRICLNGELSAALFAELGVAISCRKGLKRVPLNQDDFFAYSCGNWGLYGVFDGHGQGGHVVANFVQWHLPDVIHQYMSQTDDMKAALRFAFHEVDSMLKEASATQCFDSAASGTTASVVLHKRQEMKLYVAYVGDSTVVLARRGTQGRLIAHTVTRDHRPEDPTERSRIESLGGEIRRPVGHVPYRVFVKGKDYPGLAMSRSLGDFMGQCAGVTTEPDVLELDLVEGRDELVIMCTDGVWEFVSPHEAVDILSQYNISQAAEAVRALSCEAWKRWMDEDGHFVDDITIQLIHLFPPKPESAWTAQ